MSFFVRGGGCGVFLLETEGYKYIIIINDFFCVIAKEKISSNIETEVYFSR
jgi:hypothetical protein